MRIVIIEDEKLTADDLAETITAIEPTADIVAMPGSVREAILFLKEHERVDLIFCDIQLGDGLCFDIFKTVQVASPVIFCTAYDEHALEAFKANGIEYILKPYTKITIGNALNRFHSLKRNFAQSETYERLAEQADENSRQKTGSVLVYIRDRIIPVATDDIAVFFIKSGVAHLYTFSQKTYSIGKTMEELENMAGRTFYRANRQFLVNKKAVTAAIHYNARKLVIALSVPFNEKIVVSKEKATDFLSWLAGD